MKKECTTGPKIGAFLLRTISLKRDLRPTVIARKVSFGSQSDAGAYTRGVLMSVLYSLKKRGVDVAAHLKCALDELAKDINQDPFPLLFPRAGPIRKKP